MKSYRRNKEISVSQSVKKALEIITTKVRMRTSYQIETSGK